MGIFAFFESGQKYYRPQNLSGITGVIYKSSPGDFQPKIEWCKPGEETLAKRKVLERYREAVFDDEKPLPDPDHHVFKETPYLLVHALELCYYRPPKWWELRRLLERRYHRDIIGWLEWCRKHGEAAQATKPFPQLAAKSSSQDEAVPNAST